MVFWLRITNWKKLSECHLTTAPVSRRKVSEVQTAYRWCRLSNSITRKLLSVWAVRDKVRTHLYQSSLLPQWLLQLDWWMFLVGALIWHQCSFVQTLQQMTHWWYHPQTGLFNFTIILHILHKKSWYVEPTFDLSSLDVIMKMFGLKSAATLRPLYGSWVQRS